MIILYEYTETAFTNNGLGCLNDATSCVVSETLNGEYELEMEYPVNGIHYSDIQLRRIIFAKPNSYDREQPFRIYSISKPIGGLVTVNAEHISYDMSGLPVRGAIEHYAWYVKDVFDHIKNNSVYPCPFAFSSDITEEKKAISLSKPRSVKAFLGTDEGLLSLFGGEWEFDRYNAILHKERGQNRGVSIEYGKNLTDVTQDEACSEMYTAVYPYYYQEDDGLQRLDEDVVKILDTTYNNVCVLDLTSEFDEMPTQDQLRAKTQEYIKDNKLGEPKVSLKVSFIKNPEVIEELQDVRLGDTVGVKFIKIGVNTTSRCINYEFNVLTEQYNSIGLGEPTKTIVDTMTSTSSRIDAANSAIDDTQNDLDDEIDRATGAEGALDTRITKTEEGLEMEVSQRQTNDLDLSTRISQTPHKIDLTASGGEQSVGITIRLYDENGNLVDTSSGEANITVTGFVTFNDLENAGSTTINGANITTGTINCDLLNGGTINGQAFRQVSEYGELIIRNGVILAPSTGAILIGDNEVATQSWVQESAVVRTARTAQEADHATNASYATSAGSLAGQPSISVNQCYAEDFYFESSPSAGSSLLPIGYNSSTYHFGHYTGSSERFKNSISDKITEQELDPHRLYDADIFQYKYNADYLSNMADCRYDKLVIGFIAENLEKVYPVAVDKDDYGTIMDWNYKYVIPPMLSLIQEQHKEIEQLKSDNFALKGELDILKQKLKRLEEKLC